MKPFASASSRLSASLAPLGGEVDQCPQAHRAPCEAPQALEGVFGVRCFLE